MLGRKVILLVLLGLAGAITILTLTSGLALAQSCRSDNDCRSFRSVGAGARCIGDTLVQTTERCVSGRCQRRDVRRQNCSIGVGGRCTGSGYETTRGRCNASAERCDTRRERVSCVESCTCVGKVLTVSTGRCSPAIGCHSVVSVCRDGCSCKPNPVCKGRVEPNH